MQKKTFGTRHFPSLNVRHKLARHVPYFWRRTRVVSFTFSQRNLAEQEFRHTFSFAKCQTQTCPPCSILLAENVSDVIHETLIFFRGYFALFADKIFLVFIPKESRLCQKSNFAKHIPEILKISGMLTLKK